MRRAPARSRRKTFTILYEVDMHKLRPYQVEAIDAMWKGLESGNVLIEMPTGSGKSHVIAGFCDKALRFFPDTKILMLVHRKELVEQNAQKMRACGNYDVSVYCAALNKKRIGQITFASIQSLARAKHLPKFDLVIIDECHRIPAGGFGQYHDVIQRVEGRCCGFTATTYRLQSGKIHGEERLFPSITYRVSVKMLLAQGFLSPVIGYRGQGEADLSGVLKGSDGDFAKGQLQDAYEKDGLVRTAVSDMLQKSAGRRSLIIFAAGVRHAEMIRTELRNAGEHSEIIVGTTGQNDRQGVIDQFVRQNIRILINVGVFTEGFDAPNVDCVVLMRATLSPGLYVQMVGRGMRLFPGKENCLLLDYGSNVLRHGPIDNVYVPSDAREKAPQLTRVCPMCEQFVQIRKPVCPGCGFAFPPGESLAQAKHTGRAGEVDPIDPKDLRRWSVIDIDYRKHQKEGKPPCLMVTYKGGVGGRFRVREFVCVEHAGRGAALARSWMLRRAIMPGMIDTVDALLQEIEQTGILEPVEVIADHAGKWTELVDVVFGKPCQKIRKNTRELPESIIRPVFLRRP